MLLAAGLSGLLIFSLGGRGLNEPDEGRYANIAAAMARPGGDWWEPRMSGFAHYDKPPLIYWATACSFRAFGYNEWAARLPSLAGACMALGGLAWGAWRLCGPRLAWWAVLICGTSLQFWIFARILSPDMLLTGWCTLAIAAWAECRHRHGSWYFWALSLAFWTLAWWTKATPSLVPLGGLAGGLWLRGDERGWRALRLPLLLPAILVLGAPWYLGMLGRWPELRGFFFVRELAGRIVGRADGRHGPLLYYLPVSLAGWLPWWPLAAWRSYGKRMLPPRRLTNGELWAAWVWWIDIDGWIAIIGLATFSVVSSKLSTYALTLVPWVALAMARRIACPPSIPERWICRLAAPAAGVFAVIAVAGVLAMPAVESSLGANSSLREVCAFIQRHGGGRVDADHYWPGMEFYLDPESVRYAVHHDRQQERLSDPGLPPARFVEPGPWQTGRVANPGGIVWLVNFRKGGDSPFETVIARLGASGEKPVRIGQFDIWRTRRETAGLAAAPLPAGE